MRKHPKSEKVFELATFFHTIALTAKGTEAVVDMGACGVDKPEKHLCGTPACHAGWFGAFYPKRLPAGYGNYKGFGAYADQMGKMLGLGDSNALEEWASENPLIWGNQWGDEMFGSSEAFGEFNGEVTLQEIADHWYGVATRLAAIEKAIETIDPEVLAMINE